MAGNSMEGTGRAGICTGAAHAGGRRTNAKLLEQQPGAHPECTGARLQAQTPHSTHTHSSCAAQLQVPKNTHKGGLHTRGTKQQSSAAAPQARRQVQQVQSTGLHSNQHLTVKLYQTQHVIVMWTSNVTTHKNKTASQPTRHKHSPTAAGMRLPALLCRATHHTLYTTCLRYGTSC